MAPRRVLTGEVLAPRRVLTGEVLAPQLPCTAEALGRGDIGEEHVRIIRHFFDRLPAVVDAAVAAGGGSNAEAAALAVRQAALNARITANTQAKLKYNIEAAQLNSQQASVNARADENLAEGIRLQQQAQEFGTRVTQFTEDLGKALKPIQRGGRSEVMAEALNAIKLSQQEAAQAANAASRPLLEKPLESLRCQMADC